MSKKEKILFFDIETSGNLIYDFSCGYNKNITYNQVIKERKIICVSWKWSTEKKVHNLDWGVKKQCDKSIVKEFSEVLAEADAVVGHNSDKFDIKWLAGRALIHDLPPIPLLNKIDTLKLSRQTFCLNSHRLDYIGKLLLGQSKKPTGLQLWIDVDFHKKAEALKRMLAYCDNDVKLLEGIFNRMRPHTKLPVSFIKPEKGINKCRDCGSTDLGYRGYYHSAAGHAYRKWKCKSCGKWEQSKTREK